MPLIHLWCPSVRASQGGIESYSYGLATALREIVGEGNLTVLIRNDPPANLPAVANATTAWLPRLLWPVGFASFVVLRALRERPDLIITTHLNFGPFALFVRRLLKIPYWVTLHGYESWQIQRPSQRRAVGVADLLLPVSGFTRERVMTSYAVPAERMPLLHDTFEPERFTIGAK